MHASMSTAVTLPGTPTRRTDGRSDGTHVPDHQGEILEAAQPGREPHRDARLLLRADAPAAPERQAGRRRRRDREEEARDPDAADRAERREARDAGAPGRRGRTRGPRAAGARAQGGGPDAAPGARPAGAAVGRPAGEARLLA